MKEYQPKVTPWQIKEQDFPHKGSVTEQLLFLLRYAILAPWSHNTQPWALAPGHLTPARTNRLSSYPSPQMPDASGEIFLFKVRPYCSWSSLCSG